MSRNYRIGEQDQLESGGAKTKAKQNIAAIRLLQDLDSSDRAASPQEQSILVQYSGWGAAPDVFTAKPDWADLQNQLREILTEPEYAAARASTLNAHYTAPAVVSEVYRGLAQLGFSSGQILDPSMGATGMFEGLMPEKMAQRSNIMGVELDQISGRIARHLYPESTIHISGFQDVILPDDYFDLAISNVPFGQNRVSDSQYKGLPVNTLHDYFFAKGIDKVRPGGLVAFITSTGTMQSASGTAFREYMAERVNLIGAMRLPGDAFKAIAKTEVTTDLVILQKLGDGVEPNGVSWTHLEPTSVLDAEGRPLRTNEYYAQRPKMMLGTLADDKLYPGRLALKGDGRELAGAMREAFSQMPTGIYRHRTELEVNEIADDRVLVPPELQSRVKQDGHALYQNQVMIRTGNWLTPAGLTGKPSERVIGLISIRDAVQDVFDVQLRQGSDLELEEAQRKLSDIYDGFVEQQGYINERGNKLAFRSDPEYPLLLALEKYDRETKTATKSDIFSKRTIQPYQEKTHADTPKEGLLYSLNEKGRVDIEYIAQLTGLSAVETVAALQEDQLIFLNPDNDKYQTQDEYLSGNVRAKLADAEAALASGDPQFTINVEALKAVQPEPLGPGDIDVRLGSTWVPPRDIQDFAHELLGVTEGVSVRYSAATSSWYASNNYKVDNLASNTSIYGTEDRSAIDLIETALNLKTPSVYMTDPLDSDRRIINPEATTNARLKQEEIKQKFKDWIWQNPDRATRLTDLYNERFNIYRDREFDGSHLELPGMNPNITLRPHQKNAVWRSLFGNTLDAHAVGGGKTFTMIASGMEQKRLGLINKAMYVVPNHLLEQIAADFKRLYPTASVLAATKKDSQKSNRQELMSRIATGNWDAVIVTHSAFEKLKLSEQSQSAFINREIDEIQAALEEAEGSGGSESRRVMKDLERRRLSLEAKVEAIANSDTKDDTITFEQLGIDLLVVDEAHYFKNLGYITKMRSIAGLPNTNSNKAFNMHMMVQHMARVRGEGQGVIFATGTPITNSMAELFTMQRYLQPEVLAQAGLASFDSWASTFGETVTATELGPTGQFRVNTRFAKFSNVPDLMRMFRQVADIQTADMLNLPVPEITGGKPTVIAVPATEDQLNYMDELVIRAEDIQGREVDPSEDNMLKLTGDGRKASADMRLVDPDYLDMPNSKTNRLVRDAIAYRAKHENRKTHLIFCDLGTPKPKGEFSVYQDIKDKLVAGGIPPAEIVFAQSFKTDAQKLELQQKFNAGIVTVLISGAQLETGFNGQRKLGRISHLTVPWRPDQIEQRDGRALRQGNENESIEIFRYVTQGRNGQPGMEGYLWQTLQTKEQYISQAMRGAGQRQMEDVSEAALSYSEVKAIATGNPLIMEKATVDNKITELSAQKRSHLNSQYQVRRRLDRLPDQIQAAEVRITKLTADLACAKEAATARAVTLWGKTLSLDTDADEIGKRIRSRASVLNRSDARAEEKIGTLGRFSVSISTWGRGYETAYLLVQGQNQYSEDGILQSKAGAYKALTTAACPENLSKAISHNQSCIASYRKDLADLSKMADEPFAKEEVLRAALSRQAEINAELSIGKGDDQVIASPESDHSNTQQRLKTKQIASPKVQKGQLSKQIAKFIRELGIQKDVITPEGFYLDLEDKRNSRQATLDASPIDQGKQRLTLQFSNITLGTSSLSATAEFAVDQDGMLSLNSLTSSEKDMPQQLIEIRLGTYLKHNQFRVSTEPLGLAILETEANQCLYRFINNDDVAPHSTDNLQVLAILQSAKDRELRHRTEILTQANVIQAIATIDFPDQSSLEEFERTVVPLPIQFKYEGDLVGGFQFVDPEVKAFLDECPGLVSIPDEATLATFEQDSNFMASSEGASILEVSSVNFTVQDHSFVRFPDLMMLDIDHPYTQVLPQFEEHCQEHPKELWVLHSTRNGTHAARIDTPVRPSQADPAFMLSVEVDARYLELAQGGDEWTARVTAKQGRQNDHIRLEQIVGAGEPDPNLLRQAIAYQVALIDNGLDDAESVDRLQRIQNSDLVANHLKESTSPGVSQSSDELQEWEYEHATVRLAPKSDRLTVQFTEWAPPELQEKLEEQGFKASRATGPWSASNSPERLKTAKQMARDFSPVLSDQQKSIVEKPILKVQERAFALKPAEQHLQRAERNTARLLHDAGLAEDVMGEFYLKVENAPYIPLIIEGHPANEGTRQLCLTHYLEQEGDLTLDSEMIFKIGSDGTLRLEETAVKNPFSPGSESRIYDGGDRTFANTFTRNLISQGFATAARAQMAEVAQIPAQPKLPQLSTDETVAESNLTYGEASPSENQIIEDLGHIKPFTPGDVPATEAQSRSQAPQKTVTASHLVQDIIKSHDPELHDALTNADETVAVEASIQCLREWYVSVRNQIKAETLGPVQKQSLEERLEAIALKGRQAKENDGTVQLTSVEANQMETDLKRLKERSAEVRTVTIGELRQWYRANVETDGGRQKQRIQQLATQITDDGKEIVHVPVSDYAKMQADLRGLQARIGAESATYARRIWQEAGERKTVKVNPDGLRLLDGKNYKIVSADNRLTLFNKRTSATLTIEGNTIIQNTLAMDDVERLKQAANIRVPAAIER